MGPADMGGQIAQRPARAGRNGERRVGLADQVGEGGSAGADLRVEGLGLEWRHQTLRRLGCSQVTGSRPDASPTCCGSAAAAGTAAAATATAASRPAW